MDEIIINKEFLLRLKKLAQQATQGDWMEPEQSDDCGFSAMMRCRDDGAWVQQARTRRDIAYFTKWQNADYFAALSPKVVLAMIEKLEKANSIAPGDLGPVGMQNRDFKAVMRAWWDRFQDTPVTASEIVNDCYCEDGDFIKERQTLRETLNVVLYNCIGVNERALSAWLRKSGGLKADGMMLDLSIRKGKKYWKIVKTWDSPPCVQIIQHGQRITPNL